MTFAITDFWVDTDWCLAHYLCIDLAPVFFEMHEGGWAVSVRPAGTMSPADADAVFLAAAHCPVAAIKIRLASGETVDANSAMLKRLAIQNR
jgi:ferredoxin